MGCIKSKQGLSEEDLEFLKERTRYDEDTIKEWYKGFKQDCPDGRLTPVKFVDMYKMFFPSGNAEQFCDQIFRTFDSDKNGYIDFKEFILAINVTSAGTAEEKLKWHFKMFDVEGNGVINQEEMTKVVQAIHDFHCPDGTVATHSGGRLGGEVVTMVPVASAEERAKNIFSRMVGNGDGHLSEDEFLSGCLQDEELSKMLAPNVAQ